MNVKKTALSLGTLFVLTHLAGVLLMQAGIMNYILKIHFMNVNYTVLPMNSLTLLLGLVTAFVIGNVIGAVFSSVWNHLKD